MLVNEARQRVLNHVKTTGFTLLELMITIAILAILSLFAVPAFTGMLNNAKVRSIAEALQNGMRLAQTESIRRSHQSAFVLTDATPALGATPAANGKNWYIQILPIVTGETSTDFYVQGGSFGNQTSGVTISGPAAICFNSIGRVTANAATGLGANCAAPIGIQTYDVTRSGADRTLRLQVNATGKIRMCDVSKTLSASNPDGC